MKYSIHVNEVKTKESNIKGFATVVFGDSFKITNIAILENPERHQLFVSMPRYRSSERDENGGVIFKDVCNPITKEFREELYDNILEAYENVINQGKEQGQIEKEQSEMPEFSVKVTPFERDGSSVCGLARIYFDNQFIVNNVSILQGKDKLFVAMPAYKTRQIDEQGKAIYQDVCYPVTKEFREKLYGEVMKTYEEEKEKKQEEQKDKNDLQKEKEKSGQFQSLPDRATPFR
ncbi:SpoVG family protein [Lacrimispora sp.]|uniref:SpoVG family protein n=1 Tax=Lacrimispora sp. TaxID=2719234 RepID=UPI0028B0ED6F|nr:SpoVG family protein [Lacrimispora sp.]